ncbi:hypothetical protein PhiCh1p30 [Natrialba phage PhiCh1]|uniref:Virus protein phiCh1-VP29 n=2 Tax=root TaxID=1 RepID=D3T2H6_NATMM|nr:hypothetical protein [Natrialba magadii]NP_665947.1 hypothetical protein PhiCh1p30 [Natrialba phage PhiCh1]YP_010078057.1 uncharacterized protein KMC42_gp27 [Natrialba phage PhiCh1]AAM88703.1 unknown [Natrialba phage PhiCh1]ADD07785.1 virus protein phiCh1-VP29 [Natrialba magadii ATCC 43099]ELY23032.1 hypothetical protein C500_21250 [Natrialba magadii ATCC 43099]QBJ01208.1 uncharacterized protein PhiCh1_130 [Natrialba phage PhiCh1]
MKFKRTLAQTAEGDFRVEGGNLVFTGGAAGVEQELRTMLATIEGEDPFNPDHGLAILEAAGADPAIIERGIRSALEDDDRVSSVDAVDTDDAGANRKTTVDIDVTLVDGTSVGFDLEV